MIRSVTWKAAQAGIITGVLLAVARISGETAPLLFTALNNQFLTTNLNAPMASLPAMIFQYAMSPYDDWHRLAWAGALLVTATVLTLSIIARLLETETELIACNDRPQRQKAKIDVRDLSFFYGTTKALKNVTLPLYDRKVTAFIGPSGCGKSTLSARHQPYLRALSQPACRRRHRLRWRGHPHRQGPESAARPHRHGVPEAHAVSHVHL